MPLFNQARIDEPIYTSKIAYTISREHGEKGKVQIYSSISVLLLLLIASCIPILTPKKMEETKEIVLNFISPIGFGPVLQERLIEYDKTQKHSYVYYK
jgi:hypothetical protein